jgi:hypothetical protein
MQCYFGLHSVCGGTLLIPRVRLARADAVYWAATIFRRSWSDDLASDGTRPENNTGPRYAARGIIYVLAVNNGRGRAATYTHCRDRDRKTECETERPAGNQRAS